MASRRLRVERVDELADAVHDLRLAALQMADEVPAERVAVGCVLGLEVLRAVLADDLDSRLGQGGHVVDGDVLRGRDDRHVGADLVADAREARGDLLSGQVQGRPVSRAAGPCGAREKKRSERQRVQRSRRSTLGRAGIERRLLGGGPEVELAFVDDAVSETVSEGARDLLAHLVAARPDRRARRPPRTRGRGSSRSSRRSPSSKPAPARVEDGERRLGAVRPRHRHQHAVGAESEHRDARARPSRARLPGRRASRLRLG